MAGAGFKTFNTGDVLTASDVNTYLMQQTVMVFDDAAARTTALTGVVAEGMLSYLKDTNAVEVYDGSSWVASDDPNAIQNSIVDAKGDLISATADNTPARLPVGANNTVLTADSSTSTGLKWASASTPFSGCEVYLTSNYTLPTTTLYIVSFTSENYDTDTYHDNSTNPTRLTVPSTGYYLINAGCVLSATGSQVEIRIRRNGLDVKHNSEEGSVYSYAFGEAHCVLYMTSGQYLEMTVYHNKGSDATLFSGSYMTWFNIVRLG